MHGFAVPENVKAVPVHCTSRIDILDLLKAVEMGVDGVAVVRCGDESCKYRDIAHRVSARVKRAQELMAMLGIGAERLELLSAPAGKANPYAAVCTEFSGRVKEIGLRTVR